VADAFRNYAGVSDVAALAADDEDRYFQLMVDFVDPALSRLERPVLLTHYPLSQAALAAPSAGMPGYSDRFELFIGGVELCNGYGELTNSAIQRERFEADVRKRRERGLREIPLDEGLLAALDEGVPPCSGNAVGFDRLLAVLLEQPLSGVVAFPAKLPE
jgi:lysyl-tRNA synthetase class 2